MAQRPNDVWRARVEREAAEVAAGRLPAGQAYAASLFPETLLASTDAALTAFDGAIARLNPQADDEVFAVVKAVVIALNEINEQHGGAGYETHERERLCAYIDEALTEVGVDVDALVARAGIGRWEITDEWRDW